jgi:molybdopterin-guanine dinucleotide biosynthesis protein A
MTTSKEDGRFAGTAIVLAGGASRRMGSNKALLPLRGRRMIEVVTDQLRPAFAEILVSTERAEALDFLDLTIIVDLEPGCGPIMGIYSSLLRSSHERTVVVACDTPYVDVAFLTSLARRMDGCDAVIPIDARGVLQPTFAAYGRSMLPYLGRTIAAGRLSILDAIEIANVATVPLDDAVRPFNLNTPAEYAAFLASVTPKE